MQQLDTEERAIPGNRLGLLYSVATAVVCGSIAAIIQQLQQQAEKYCSS